MIEKTTIKQWAKDDRPREKLEALGPDKLSNSELLAILIQNGTPTKSALDLAREVLKLGQDNLNELGKLSLKELTTVKGIGKAKAVTITAALELGRRRHAGDLLQREMIKGSKDLAEFLKSRLQDLRREVFAVIFLNNAMKIIDFEIVSEGGMTGTVVDPRIILKKAIEKNAVNIILSHNHPSGNLQPSRADELLTQKLKEGARLLDISVRDHIIVSETGFYSFAEEGLL